MENEKYPYGVGIVTDGKVMHVRREYFTLGGLVDGYRAMLKFYSGNQFVKPIPFEKRGRREIRRIEEVVLGVEMGLSTGKILKNIEDRIFSLRLARHYNN